MYKIVQTSKFKKDLKSAIKRGYNMHLLDNVITILSNGKTLPQSNKDHFLTWQYKGFRECHVDPDWLLVYKLDNDLLILHLIRTGSHSDLF